MTFLKRAGYGGSPLPVFGKAEQEGIPVTGQFGLPSKVLSPKQTKGNTHIRQNRKIKHYKCHTKI